MFNVWLLVVCDVSCGVLVCLGLTICYCYFVALCVGLTLFMIAFVLDCYVYG